MKANIGVVSDLYRAGMTEDGQEYSAERYFVTAEFEDGTTFDHYANFLGCEVVQGEDGNLFRDIRPEAKAKAEKLAAKIKESLDNGESLNLDFWFERKRYGH